MKDSSTATERVGRYQLLEPIGGGPNGVVSRAKVFGVAGFERQFAVKRFHSELTVGAVAQALSAAARSYGSLEHPRIARMSEFGVAQGQTFTAVEYVAGLDAFRLLQEAKLAGVAIPAGGALALVSQAARAVGYAHGRGLSHLGLSPTNVIVTVDGDVKVTDFGILAATMPQNPIESPRLAQRIPYLAPEQLAGESTSAATDVFVLGVIAYELVTGQRAYRGETPAQIAQAILAGPPAEPPLPRPIVRVLQRCLARSPFERFPDARALADALDAALRVAPVPGTRKDVGAQIKTTLDRYASLNEGNLSGMVALNLQVASAPAGTVDPHDISTQPFQRNDDLLRTEPSPIVPSSGATLQDMPKPFSTVPGIAPPPIPVPPGVTPPPGATPNAAGGAKTMLGLSPVKKSIVPSVIPPIGGRPNGPPGPPPGPPSPPPRPPTPPTRATPPPMPAVQVPDEVIEEPSGLIEVDDLTPPPVSVPADSGKMSVQDPATMQGTGIGTPGGTLSPSQLARLPKPTPGQSFETRTGEMSPVMLDELNRRSVKNTAELLSLQKAQQQAPEADPAGFANALQAAVELEADEPPPRQEPPPPQEPPPQRSQPPATTITGLAPPPQAAPPAMLSAPPMTSASAVSAATSEPRRPQPAPQPTPSAAPPAPRSKVGVIVLVLIVLGGLGAAGWYAWTTLNKPKQPVVADKGSASPTKPVEPKHGGSAGSGSAIATNPPPSPDAAVAVAAVATPDAAVAKAAPADAATQVAAVTPDAGAKAPDKTNVEVVKPAGSSDKLKITSKPAGARVFIDGADQGTTPVTLGGSADRHTMVILLPGHDLYIGEVDGHGVFDIALKPITPTGGHAGIKVIKCKAKERYYVYVDAKPTGMTCPTERIDTVVGAHTVEVYDIVTDSRRKWDIFVKDERLSARVRIDD